MAKVWRAEWNVICFIMPISDMIFVETGIAPAVARKVEDSLGPGHRPVLEQNVVRHFEQPDVYFGTRFAARRTDPQLFIHLLDIFQRKVLHVDIRQAGETAEQKGIPDKL